MAKKTTALVATSLLVLLSTSCERRRPEPPQQYTPAFPEKRVKFLLAFVLDLSPSFSEKMLTGDAIAYQFVLRAISKFCRSRTGPENKILITQISGNSDQKALLWEGSPMAFKRRFSSPSAFRAFLLDKSHRGGSPIYSATATTLEYLLSRPGVTAGQTKLMSLVVSDMESNSEPATAEDRLVQALHRFGEHPNTAVGMYWVAQHELEKWSFHLEDAGMVYILSPEISDEVPFPNLEWNGSRPPPAPIPGGP